jgi:hypothetical protein
MRELRLAETPTLLGWAISLRTADQDQESLATAAVAPDLEHFPARTVLDQKAAVHFLTAEVSAG